MMIGKKFTNGEGRTFTIMDKVREHHHDHYLIRFEDGTYTHVGVFEVLNCNEVKDDKQLLQG